MTSSRDVPGHGAGAYDLQHTEHLCREALRRDDLRQAATALKQAGISELEGVRLVERVTEDVATRAPIGRINSRVLPDEAAERRALERLLLVHTAIEALPRVPHLPVSDDVKRRLCAEFAFFAAEPTDAGWFDVETASFTAMCKLATFRRFPAGQFDWEVSGISRRDMLGVGARRLPATLAFVAFRMHGLGPVFFSHLNPRREHRSLLEGEANRSYYRMAEAMALQPRIRGFAACSWFRSPATHRASPRLAWLSDVFVENGGMVVESGPENPHGGALARSATRQRLYDAGQFRPTRGLVLWPRAAMLAWAARHPELAEDGVRPQGSDLPGV
ncbi:MAG: hypothetical protein ACRD1U_05895 [Vicinamibacterales bacterium]